MGAAVFVDGKRYDETPCLLGEPAGLAVGTHEVKLTKEGFSDYTASVTLKENEETVLSGIRLSAIEKKEEPESIPVSETLEQDARVVSIETSAEWQADADAQKAEKNKVKMPDATISPDRLFRKTSFYLDAHFGMGNPMAAGAAVGAYLGDFNVEGAYDVALGGTTTVNWYRLDSSSGAYTSLAVKYAPLSLISGNVGYGILIGNNFRLTPRVGAGVLAINSTVGATQKTYILSGTASVKAEVALTRLLSLYVAPAYSLPLQRGATAERLKDSVAEFSKWNNGLSLRIGLCLNF